MKLDNITIENLRAIKQATITFGDYTCLVGANGSGKSTVLTALNILFRQSSDTGTNLLVLEEQDFHAKDTSQAIRVAATFRDLDSEAQKDFSHYYRQGKLILSAVAKWEPHANNAPVKQVGLRTGMLDFAPFFKAADEGAKVEEVLKPLYLGLRQKHPLLPIPGPKGTMTKALHDFEAANPNLCSEIESHHEFYGVSKGANLLEKYVQWIFVPAVKDASTENNDAGRTALGKILQRTVYSKLSFDKPLRALREEVLSKYEDILKKEEAALSSISTSLTKRIQEWAHPNTGIDVRWHYEARDAVKLADPTARIVAIEEIFKGDLARFGHGFQRCFLLALLQELVEADTSKQPTLILGCEEPELYQHPPQILHLAGTLQRLSETGSQMLLTTHSPLLIKGEGFEDIRMVRRIPAGTEASVKRVAFDDYAKRIAAARGEKPSKPTGTALKLSQTLQPNINEMFFANSIVLVEGIEDEAYISGYLVLLDMWERYRKTGTQIIVTNGKGRMWSPLAVAQEFKIPAFCIFDADADKCGCPDNKKRHEKDNRTLLNLMAAASAPAFPDPSSFQSAFIMWKDDIATEIAQELGKAKWDDYRSKVKNSLGAADVADVYKTPPYINGLLEKLWDDGIKIETLRKVCEAIIVFAEAARGEEKAVGVK